MDFPPCVYLHYTIPHLYLHLFILLNYIGICSVWGWLCITVFSFTSLVYLNFPLTQSFYLIFLKNPLYSVIIDIETELTEKGHCNIIHLIASSTQKLYTISDLQYVIAS